MGFDLLTEARTTADIRDLAFPRWLAGSLARLFDVEDLWVWWVADEATHAVSAPWSALSEGDLQAIYSRGAIALGDQREEAVAAGLQWLRMSAREFGRATARPMSTLRVNCDSASLANASFRTAFVRWCSEAVRMIDAAYLTARSTRVYVQRTPHAGGLEAGLQDVCWLNVFGREFVDLIGEDRLLSAPLARSERIEPEHVLLMADDGLLQPPPTNNALEPWPPTRALVDPIIDHLGREFFVQHRPAAHSPPVMGLLRGLRHLRSQDRSFADPAATAQQRPAFDYSAVIERDQTSPRGFARRLRFPRRL